MSMNGAVPLPGDVLGTLPPVGNPELIRLIEHVLAQARRGEIDTAGIVTSTPGRTPTGMAIGRVGDVLWGCDILKLHLLQQGQRPPGAGLLLPSRG